ncbi:anaerobic ribonucleoside-triphosphate reductase activating protein [bacterium]|nr:anaerobic ribonucleoside-triphosphate reductase activating protein [bacterium]
MIVSGFQKLTLLDYPNKVAALIFTGGCNYRCPYCQNSPLICDYEIIDESYVFDYLEKRKKILDGVCISGGEPLLQKDIKFFIKKIKDMGFEVKLDTNGSFPDKLKDLIDANLIDYIAMDIKNDFENYSKTVGVKNVNVDDIKKSIKYIKESNIEHEFRTTIMKEFHSVDNILNICKYIGKNEKYFLQNYVESENVLNKGLTSFSDGELTEIINEINKKYINVQVRYL